MNPATKRPDAFGAMLAALQAAYEDEIHRLAEALRVRILAGEFSGTTPPPNDEGRHLRLEMELRAHRWTKTPRLARAVLACSSWPEGGACTRDDTTGWTDGEIAAEVMAHDVLALAAKRGWVKRYRDAAPYALKVA